jgi:hypothetical protein
MNIIGPLIIIAYLIFVPGQIFVRLLILLAKKKSLFHFKIAAIEFCGLAIIYFQAFQNFDSYYGEQHLVNKIYSMLILFIGFLAYFINSILVDKTRKGIEILLQLIMGASLLYSLFSILELLFQNEFKLLKVLLMQLPYPLLMIIGLLIYKYRPAPRTSDSEHVQF